MINRFIRIAGILIITAVLTVGCALKRPVAVAPQKEVIPKITVESLPSGSRPDWVASSRDFWISGKRIFCVGVARNSPALDSSLREAEDNARIKLLANLKGMMFAEFRNALSQCRHDADTGEYVSKTFSASLESVQLPDFVQKQAYSEKVSEVLPEAEKVFYRSFILMEMSGDAYARGMQQIMAQVKIETRKDAKAQKLLRSIEKLVKG